MKLCTVAPSPRESSADFYIRLKSLSEETDVCTAHSKECEKVLIKHKILMYARGEQLVQRLIFLVAFCTL